MGHGLLIHEVSRSHTTTHHSRQDSSERVISSSQRPLPDNTQHSQQTDIHVHCGIRTHNLSRRAATDLRLRPRGHRDRPSPHIWTPFLSLHVRYIPRTSPTPLFSYVIYLANSNCTLFRIFRRKIYILVSPLPLTFQVPYDVIVKHPLRHRVVFKTLGMHLPPCPPLPSNGGQVSELQYTLGYLLCKYFIAHLHAS